MVSTIGSAVPRRLCQFDSVPCGSVSISRTVCPAFLAASASPIANVLLPLPPFWVANTIVCIRQRFLWVFLARGYAEQGASVLDAGAGLVCDALADNGSKGSLFESRDRR